MNNLVLAASVYARGVLPDPRPVQPPGTEGITTLMNWISWAVLAAGIAGFLISVGILIFGALTGREQQGFKGMAIAILGSILAAGVGGIMRVFV